jgi:hypothetical protein
MCFSADVRWSGCAVQAEAVLAGVRRGKVPEPFLGFFVDAPTLVQAQTRGCVMASLVSGRTLSWRPLDFHTSQGFV